MLVLHRKLLIFEHVSDQIFIFEDPWTPNTRKWNTVRKEIFMCVQMRIGFWCLLRPTLQCRQLLYSTCNFRQCRQRRQVKPVSQAALQGNKSQRNQVVCVRNASHVKLATRRTACRLPDSTGHTLRWKHRQIKLIARLLRDFFNYRSIVGHHLATARQEFLLNWITWI